MNSEYARFLAINGNVKNAALDIGISQERISQFKAGRELSKSVAKLIKDKYPQLSLYKLLYEKGP